MIRTGPFLKGHVIFMTLSIALSLGGAAEAVPLHITVVDEASKTQIPCRVLVADDDGSSYYPDNAVLAKIGPTDIWFLSNGDATVDVPPGKYMLRAERGIEYTSASAKVRIEVDKEHREQIALQRWVNMREEGYVSADNDIHVPLNELPAHLAAEQLDFGTSIQWFNRPLYEPPSGEGYLRKLRYENKRITTSVLDYQLETPWGTALVIGQSTPQHGRASERTPSMEMLGKSHEAGALVCYEAGWMREATLDALLGIVDVVNVCNARFLRHAYRPCEDCYNPFKLDSMKRIADSAAGMMRANELAYFRLLNCGLRLAAGGGSGAGLWNTPVGYNRVYVRAGKDPTYEDFIKAWRQGRNFATNDAVLDLSIDNKYEPGDVIQYDSSHSTRELVVRARAQSAHSLHELDLIVNGTVVRSADIHSRERGGSVSYHLQPTEGSWVIARARSSGQMITSSQLEAYRSGDRDNRIEPCPSQYAYTSPIYIEVDGKGAHVQSAVDETLAFLDAFEKYAGEQVRGRYRRDLLEAVDKARTRLEQGITYETGDK